MVSCSHPMNAVSTPTSGHTPFPGGGGGGVAGGPPHHHHNSWSESSGHHAEQQAGSISHPPPPGTGQQQLRLQLSGGTPLRGHHPPPPPLTPTGYGGPPPPHDFPLPGAALMRPMGLPPRGAPFFIREIYKNGFLKRLPYNEKKSSALAKLMKSDRFWVVFSIHDDIHPFLELWHEPTEVANRPPQHIFPLAACQHISTSIVPAGDSEWSFVINFDSAIAIRFSCNSREVMDDWVEVIRAKLAEMGILNPKGNLYSRTPLGPPVTKPVIRDPTSPLPQPPPPPPPPPQPVATEATAANNSDSADAMMNLTPRKLADEASNHPSTTTSGTTTTTTTRTKAVIGTMGGHQASSSFTTSIYLNRSSMGDGATNAGGSGNNNNNSGSVGDHLAVGRKTSLPPPPTSTVVGGGGAKAKVIAAAVKSMSALGQSMADVKISSAPLDFGKNGDGGGGGATSSVYLNQSSPTRHVTVIPVNSGEAAEDEEEEKKKKESSRLGASSWLEEPADGASAPLDMVENHTYGAIFHFDESAASSRTNGGMDGEKSKTGGTGTSSSGGVGAVMGRSELKSPVRRQPVSGGNSSTAAAETVSPSRRGRDRTSRTTSAATMTSNAAAVANGGDEPPPLPERPVALFRRLSERRHEAAAATPAGSTNHNIHNGGNNNPHHHGKANKIRRKSRRSSSLGPFLDRAASQQAGAEGGEGVGASTLSLESVDSNPRQAVPRAERRCLGAVPRPRPLLHVATYARPSDATITTGGGGAGLHEPAGGAGTAGSPGHLLGSPSRPLNELVLGGVAGPRPPFYHHPLVAAHGAGAVQPTPTAGFPPMVPLPGLTCQLSMPPGLALPGPLHPEERAGAGAQQQQQQQQRSLLEQQVLRMRQEIAHPAGVRLILRKKDVQSSLALVDLFGCVWVVGWKQREYPVLCNAFHLGDQILSVSGIIIRNSGEFSKLVKLKSNEPHTEIIIRRVPFAQIFYLKSEVEGESLGILTHSATPEIKEVIAGSLAAQAGINSKIRRIDGQTMVPLVLTELNGRHISLFSKDGEAWERLQSCGREVSVLLQPADILDKMRKQFKSLRSYKDFVLT